MTASNVFLFAKKARLQIFLLALAALYFLSAPKSEKSFKTALLNPKYNVDQIFLSDPQNGSLELKKIGSFWFGQKEFLANSQESLCFVCDSFMVQSFIKGLKNIVRVYEVSGKKNLKAFGLQEGQSFLLRAKKDGKEVTCVNFGSVDSQKRIFFCVPKRQKIFSVQSDFLIPYISTAPSLWASPEIFPKSLVGADKKYRRGKIALESGATSLASERGAGLPLLAQNVNWQGATVKTFDTQDGNVYRAYFLPKTDGDYYYWLNVSPSAQRTQQEKEALKKINAVFNVSAWTFERVMEQE